MRKLTIESIKKDWLLVFESIAGSKSYGLDTAKSDIGIRGVFCPALNMFYGLEWIAQVNNETNDIGYYELKRFVELLVKHSFNILEMLSIPERYIFYGDEMMNMLKPAIFLSKLCEQTFANYAFTQIKKAYGLEKKIVNPVAAEKKSLLDFCFVYENKEAIVLKNF